MSVERTTVYKWTCDRCGLVICAEEMSDDDDASELPASWSRVVVSGNRCREAELCATCSDGVLAATKLEGT